MAYKRHKLDEKGRNNIKRDPKPIEYIIKNNCWECVSHYSKNENGYPMVCRRNKKYTMNRYVYLIYKGEIPEGFVVMHSCDNPKCINPEHLSVGTYKDNAKDMLDKGRHNPRRKLSNEQLIELKKCLAENKLKQVEIAEKFNISPSVVSNIKNGKFYK